MRSFEVDMLLYTIGQMNIKGGVTHLKKIMDNFERNLRKLKTAAVLLKEYRKLSLPTLFIYLSAINSLYYHVFHSLKILF